MVTWFFTKPPRAEPRATSIKDSDSDHWKPLALHFTTMISHSNCNFLMDWEPAESCYMDVDMTEGPFSFTDCDVYMAPPIVQEVHMASPILTSQPPTISEITFFLPPLEMKMKPIVFPPFNIHALSRQALKPPVGPREIKVVPLDDSFVYVPAVGTYQSEPPTKASASSQGDTYTSVHNHNHFPSNSVSVYRPVTPSPLKSRTTLRDILVKTIDILDEESRIADTRVATLSPLIESTSSAGPDEMAGRGDITPSVDCIPWPDSIDEQDVAPSTPHLVTETNTPKWIDEQNVTPSTPHLVVAETNTPEWIDEQDLTPSRPSLFGAEANTSEWNDEQDVTPSTPHLVVAETNTPEWIDEQDVTPSPPSLVGVETNTPEWIDEQDVTPSAPHPVIAETTTPEWTVDEDVTPLSQYSILETGTPEMTFFQEFDDWGVDLVGLWSPKFEIPNFNEYDAVLRAFGVSRIEDLDWILEGFRAISVADACIESKSDSNGFESMFVPAPLHNFSPVSSYDWAVFEASPNLISFDSAYNIHSGSFKLPSLESGDVLQFESNGLFHASTPYNRSALTDVRSSSPFDPLIIFNKATYTVERNAPRSTKTDASTQTEESPGATYGMSF